MDKKTELKELSPTVVLGVSKKQLEEAKKFKSGCTIYLKDVPKPENYGVVKIKNNKINLITEKPQKFISSKAITGLYLFDNKVRRK